MIEPEVASLSPIRLIAKVCHEVNRAYCRSLGDHSQLAWEDAPDWQKDSAVHGVLFKLNNPLATAKDQHDEWLKVKVRTGWKWGPVKDAALKLHPCVCSYEELPIAQQTKDHLFAAVVSAHLASPQKT